MSAIKIDKNIPIPDFSAMKKPRGLSSKYPFDLMADVGDSFSVPYTEWTTATGANTNTFERVRATVGQRNRRDRSREFQPALMEENGAKVVRVWLLRDDKNSTPEAAPAPEAPVENKEDRAPAKAKPAPAAVAKG